MRYKAKLGSSAAAVAPITRLPVQLVVFLTWVGLVPDLYVELESKFCEKYKGIIWSQLK